MCNKAVKALIAEAWQKPPSLYSGLQLFADAGGDGGGGGDSGEDDGSDDDDDDDDDDNGDGSSKNGSQPPPSFDDFLKQKENQAEFDKRVQAAVAQAVRTAQTKWQSMTDDKLSEAEKLAKMTKEERLEYIRQKERKEFEEEKAAFEREKLLVEITKELQTQTLPTAFAESLVNISDAEKIKEAISGIKKAWDAEIAEAVKSKARQSTPQEGGQVIEARRGLSSIRKLASENRIIKN